MMAEGTDRANARDEYNGLAEVQPGLPSEQYYASGHFERELQRIWHRHWLYLCRADTLARALDYRTFEIGAQPLLLLRDEAGALRAFFNTCRHRGSVLCAEGAGRLRASSLTCPYHGWTYDLRGRLARIPSHGRPAPMDREAYAGYALYELALREWGGFVFVSLSDEASTGFEAAFEPGLETLAHWPLQELAVGHTHTMTLRCNWKVFWDNYNECLHCPNVHPALAALVPIYGRAIMAEQDDRNWRAHAQSADPKFKGGLRAHAETWSRDGRAGAHRFEALSEAERRMGYHFVTMLPSMYMVGHVDYVRAVRLRPLGPGETELEAQWLYPRAALDDPSFDVHNTVDFATQVLTEDARVCELAQRGLRARPHRHGVLLPEEYELARFHRWVRAALERP